MFSGSLFCLYTAGHVTNSQAAGPHKTGPPGKKLDPCQEKHCVLARSRVEGCVILPCTSTFAVVAFLDKNAAFCMLACARWRIFVAETP